MNLVAIRVQRLNRFIVNDYFSKLERVQTDLQLFDKPDRIFSIYEKGSQLLHHHVVCEPDDTDNAHDVTTYAQPADKDTPHYSTTTTLPRSGVYRLTIGRTSAVRCGTYTFTAIASSQQCH